MTKLKKKVFCLTFIILTISVLGFILVFNIQNYVEQKRQIENSFDLANNKEEKTPSKNYENDPPEKPEDSENDNDIDTEEKQKDIKFMDKTIYKVLLDDKNNIIGVVNFSNNDISENKIKKIANNLLKENNESKTYIGFLYLEKYSYKYEKNNYLIILDNSTIKQSLLNSLKPAIISFVLLEIMIFIISKVITGSIIKPVIESFDNQKRFIADASHELKTPLSVIIASSEALEKNSNEKKWLNNIKSESNRMEILIKNLLDLASSEKKSAYKFREDNLSKTVELALLPFDGVAFENNIKITSSIDKDIHFKYDDNAIKELVEIIIDNALKHADKKTIINVVLKEEKNLIKLSISNEGDEIPKGEENKIFERFYRVDKSRNRKENRYGLGLSIAKNIVENHNGIISAESKDKITTFKVLFKK